MTSIFELYESTAQKQTPETIEALKIFSNEIRSIMKESSSLKEIREEESAISQDTGFILSKIFFNQERKQRFIESIVNKFNGEK